MAIRGLVKRSIDACSVVAVAPLWALCALESKFGGRAAAFTFSSQLCALVPGLPGVFLRRAFYRLTLESCGRSFFVGFGAVFSHRAARVADDGRRSLPVLGACDLGRGCLIGTRCSIISGGALLARRIRTLDAHRRPPADDPRRR